jgi:thiamine biosynthesis lipoprotein
MNRFCTIFITALVLVSCEEKLQQTKTTGQIFGTSFSIIYDGEQSFETEFDSLFFEINRSMSTYVINSYISKINRNEPVEVDHHFEKVFKASQQVYRRTNGKFDPTIGAVVNAWDFGPEGKIESIDSLKIQTLMESVGLDQVQLVNRQVSKPQGTYIDFNAIAKGYGVDVISLFLETEGIDNYLVEIGGEIRCKGINTKKNSEWRVGVQNPNLQSENRYVNTIPLINQSMATSGTYRKFKIDANGNRYTHIIDTKTGYPSRTNILSVSVIAEDCMTADAYATALQAMGVQGVSSFLKLHPELQVFIVFENDKQDLDTQAFNGFPDA